MAPAGAVNSDDEMQDEQSSFIVVDEDHEDFDELIIDLEKKDTLSTCIERVQIQYDVKITFGLVATDQVKPKQWVSVAGKADDRKAAKDFIKSCCSPSDVQAVSMDPSLIEIIARPKVLSKIEKQSKSCIAFIDESNLEIRAQDNLGIIMAYSAIEDLIGSQNNNDVADVASPVTSPTVNQQSSRRLDSELRRLTSQDEDFKLDQDFSLVDNAVKRTLLGLYREESPRTSKSSSRTSVGPSALANDGDVSMSSQGASAAKSPAHSMGACAFPSPTISQGAASSENNFMNSLSSIASGSPDRPADTSLPSSSKVTPVGNLHITGREQELRDYGFNMGYTDEEIDNVLIANIGINLKDADFIKLLVKARHSPSKSKNEDKNTPSGSSLDAGATTSGASAKPSTPSRPGCSSHPLESILSPANQDALSRNSPVVGDDKEFVSYLQLLSKDFEVEDGTNEDDTATFRKNNQQRMTFLKEVIDRRKQGNQDSVEEVTVISGGQKMVTDIIEIGESEDSDDDVMEIDVDVSTKGAAAATPTAAAPTAGSSSTAAANSQKQSKSKKRKGKRGAAMSPQVNQQARVSPALANPAASQPQRDTRQTRWDNSRTPPAAYARDMQNSPQGHRGHRRMESPAGSPRRDRQGRRDSPQRFRSPPRPSREPHGGARQRTSVCEQTRPPHRHSAMNIQQTSPHHAKKGSNARKKRYIVIDGSNVAMAHGNHKVFSCKGIQLCINHFLGLGHTEVTAIVPQWQRQRGNEFRQKCPIRDQNLLEEMAETGRLAFSPSRRVDGVNICPYDDKFIMELANHTDGIVISNDNYRDIYVDEPRFRHIIETRLMGFTVASDFFMFPSDPLGKNGPTIDEFLHHMDPDTEEKYNPLRVRQLEPRREQRYPVRRTRSTERYCPYSRAPQSKKHYRKHTK